MESKIYVMTIIIVTTVGVFGVFLPSDMSEYESEEIDKCTPIFYESNYFCDEHCPSPSECFEIKINNNFTCYRCLYVPPTEGLPCGDIKLQKPCDVHNAFNSPVDAVKYCNKHYYYKAKYDMKKCYHCRFGFYCESTSENGLL